MLELRVLMHDNVHKCIDLGDKPDHLGRVNTKPNLLPSLGNIGVGPYVFFHTGHTRDFKVKGKLNHS